MKKHLALVLALVMVLSSFSFVSAAPDFSDMEGHANAEAVARLELLNVLKGYPDGTFKPDNTITRAEFAAVAVRVSGLENVAMAAKGLPTGFSDVPAWHWASGYVGTAAKSGIVNGIGNGLFAPETPVKYEEAITMIVRALGYEPMAQARGGYPFGYLIVANEIDLLEDAMGTQGTWATRGFVAQITDNALEIPMMIQVGFGSDTKWVVSGKDDTDEEYLLDRMGFDTVEGRVTTYSTSRDTITVKGDTTEVLDVADNFDYYNVYGVTIKAWVDGDMVIVYTLKDDVKFDAVEVDDDELTLIGEDENYEVASRAEFLIDGESADWDEFNVDYAKVVFNDDNDIIWAEGFSFDGFIVVEEVDDEIIYDYDDGEVEVEDFTVVKAGKTIGIEGIEEEDVVFYNLDEEFAVVYNSSEMGVIDRAYTDSFRMDGTVYSLAIGALYLEDGDMGDVTSTVLEEYVDEADEVEIFFNFYGDVVLIAGSKGTAKTTSFGLYLESAGRTYIDNRTGRIFLALDGVNSEDVSLSFDAEVLKRDGSETTFYKDSVATNKTTDEDVTWFPAETVIKYTIDEDGSLTKVMELEDASYDEADKFKITDRYAGDYRLKSSTVMFLLDSDGDLDEVFALSEAAEYFEEVTIFDVYSEKGVYADYIVVVESDAATNTEEVGVVTRVRNMANGDKELTINIAGKSYVFVVETADVVKGDIVSFLINDDMDEIKDVKASLVGRDDLIGTITSGEFTLENLRDRTFTLDTSDKMFELDNAVILDATGTTKTITFSAIDDGDYVNVYYEGDRATVFVKYLVVVNPPTAPVVVDKTELNAIKAEVNAIIADQDANGTYTTESYDDFMVQVGVANAMPEETQVEVDAKTAAYQDAIDMLVLAPFEGTVTFISTNKMTMAVSGEVFTANANTRVYAADGTTIIGVGEFAGLTVGDLVSIDGDVVTIVTP